MTFFEKIIVFISKIIGFIFKILLTPARFLYKILLVYIFIPIYSMLKKFISFLSSKYINIYSKRGKLNEKREEYKNKQKKAVLGNFIRCCRVHAHKGGNAPAGDNKEQ